jgi:hypothetical protein
MVMRVVDKDLQGKHPERNNPRVAEERYLAITW